MQPGSPYGPLANEPNVELQAAIATLSTGPVGPSDAVGKYQGFWVNNVNIAPNTLSTPCAAKLNCFRECTKPVKPLLNRVGHKIKIKFSLYS